MIEYMQTALNRRRALGLVGGLALSGFTSQSAYAQTLVEDSPEYGRGRDIVTTPRSVLEPVPTVAPKVAPRDWREFLLMGERSVTLRRDGAVQTFRYLTKEGNYDMSAYNDACVMMRDVHENKVFLMDPRLFDIVCGMQRWMQYNGRSAVFELISGFRTNKTNSSIEGSAKDSMHMKGRALDIAILGVPARVTGAMALEFNQNGGVGIYLNRGTVHVDTGGSRVWQSDAPSRLAKSKA